jgi:hypothetical protein
VCLGGACVSCATANDPEGTCATVTPPTPHCLTTGPDTGKCVGCRDANDCSAPKAFCDTTSHVCRGCITDAECPSLVCDLIPTSTTKGVCVDPSNIVYVNLTSGNDANDGSSGMPVQNIKAAISKTTTTRNIIHLAAPGGMATTYSKDDTIVSGKNLVFVGESGAIIQAHDGGNSLYVTNSSLVTLRNVIVGNRATTNDGVYCDGGTFAAYYSSIINVGRYGAESTGSCTFILDGVFIYNNNSGGLNLGGSFTVQNSIIAGNKANGGVNQSGSPTTMAFVNNTVAFNSTNSNNGGVSAANAGSFTIVNTILFGNGGSGEANLTTSFCATDDAADTNAKVALSATVPPRFAMTGMMSQPAWYHLASDSPCRGQAAASAAPKYDFDGQPRPDPTTGMVDIGADQYYP